MFAWLQCGSVACGEGGHCHVWPGIIISRSH